jgi:hypothetical protein
MRTPTPAGLQLSSQRGKQALWVVTVLAVAAGMFKTNSFDEFVGYALVTLASVAPAILWVRMGAPGIPVLPAAAIVYYLYYALPILTGNLGEQTDGYYSPQEILSAALTVTLFLTVTTLFWWIQLSRMAGARAGKAIVMSSKQFDRLTLPGLVLGLTYYFTVAAGLIGAAGTFSNFLRTIAVSALLVSCYTLGYGRARRIVAGTRWSLLLVVLCTIMILAWSSLFLVDGLIMAGVTGAGYVFTCKRVPWRTCLFGLALVAILHAGKGDMRAKYWVEDTNSLSSASITVIPQRMTEWLATGVANLVSGEANEEGQTLFNRASLFWLLLRVQHLTPDEIPYLDGETYTIVPQIIVPRFIAPDKPTTQEAMSLLNVRYGVLTREGTESTAVGWGLIGEAYANFGNVGVAGIAMFVGLAVGLLMRASIGRQAVSLPSLISVASLNTMINLEWDSSYVILNTGQAIVALTILYVLSSIGTKPAPQFSLSTRRMASAASPQGRHPAHKSSLGAPS